MYSEVDNLNIETAYDLVSPQTIMNEIPILPEVSSFVSNTRKEISDIILGNNDRLLIIVGPCSIHDVESAVDYGFLLKKAISYYKQDLCIIMRTYFEKPRTTLGWKGMIKDPFLDGTPNVENGLRLARNLLLTLNQIDVPTGTEFLDTVTPPFISDLVSWVAIGARTTESQIHRELASGLSMPVGFKNGTNGHPQTAIDAVYSASHPHHLLNINKNGKLSLFKTKGNKICHIVLRGGVGKTNYEGNHIKDTIKILTDFRLTPHVMIDCSHGNSNKDHTRQKIVVENIASQVGAGEYGIVGAMIESNLVAGSQVIRPKNELVYGQSITDACIDWEETQEFFDKMAAAVQKRREVKGV